MDPLKKICKHILATGQVLLCLTHVELLPKYLTEEQMWGILSSNTVVTLDANSLQFVLFLLFLFLDLCCWMQKAFCVHYIWHLTLGNHETLTYYTVAADAAALRSLFRDDFSSSFICNSLNRLFHLRVPFRLPLSQVSDSIFILMIQVSLYLTLTSITSPKQEVDRIPILPQAKTDELIGSMYMFFIFRSEE